MDDIITELFADPLVEIIPPELTVSLLPWARSVEQLDKAMPVNSGLAP